MSANKMANARPVLNNWDLPELMPGAQPSCNNPAQKEEFHTRCENIWAYEKKNDKRDQRLEKKDKAKLCQQQLDQLIDMFPNLDKTLISVMFMDAWGQSQGDALAKTCEQLIQLNDAGAGDGKIEVDKINNSNISSTVPGTTSSSSDRHLSEENLNAAEAEKNYVVDGKRTNFGDYFPDSTNMSRKNSLDNKNTNSPERKNPRKITDEQNLMCDKDEMFPVLTDKDGWQVLGAEQMKEMEKDVINAAENENIENLDSENADKKPNWSSVAIAAKDLPAPPSTLLESPPKHIYGAKKRVGKNNIDDEYIDEEGNVNGRSGAQEEYDLRQQLGKKREKKFLKNKTECPDDVDLANEMAATEGLEGDEYAFVDDEGYGDEMH